MPSAKEFRLNKSTTHDANDLAADVFNRLA